MILADTPGVANVTTVVGFSLLSGVQYYSAFFWVTLKAWGERKAPRSSMQPSKPES